MTVQHQKTTAQPSAPPSLARLRVREAALRHQAAQLQARAEHLDRVGRAHAQQLQRRIDAHEKIVLGALVKKAGLDVCRGAGVTAAKQSSNDAVLSSIVLKAEDEDGGSVPTPQDQQL